MNRKFSELAARMSPESRARAEERARELLQEVCGRLDPAEERTLDEEGTERDLPDRPER